MIHNTEDKVVTINLQKAWTRYSPLSVYSAGDVVFYSGKYWTFSGGAPAQDSTPSDTNADWTMETGVPVYDTSNITKMIIVLYYAGSRNVIEKYSLNANAEFKGIDGTDAVNGNYSINVLSALTKDKKEGKILAEAKIVEAKAGFGSGFTTIITGIEISEFNTPITEYIDAP